MHINFTSGVSTRLLYVTIFLALYLTSLFLPAFHLANGNVTDSLVILLLGWFAMLSGQFAWIANSFALAAVGFYLSGSFRKSFWLALLAAVASLNTFTMIGEEVVLDEGGRSSKVVQLGGGAYFWLASMLLLLTCCATYAWRERALAKRVA